MSTIDLLNTWSTLSTDEIATRLASGQDVPGATELFGAEEAAALVASSPPAATRRPSAQKEAVVLVPGVMGSLLTSVRGITTLLWLNPALMLRGEAGYLQMDDAGRGDLHPEIETVAFALDKLCYLKIALTLRREAELFEFPYDWRRSILDNAALLGKTLERWAAGKEKRFTLVAHSMGGLVARAFVAAYPYAAASHVKSVISLGTPYFGTIEAVENLLLGNTLMNLAGQLNPKNLVDEVVLSMPSLYQLLPAPEGVLPSTAERPVNWDVYDAKAWRREGIRERFLRSSEGLHSRLAKADPQVRTVQIAGCNVETATALERSFTPDERPVFATVRHEEGPLSGDGPVPLWSAVHPKIDTYYVEEQHRYLPSNAAVQASVLDTVYGGAPCLPASVPEKHRWWQPREVGPASATQRAEELRRRIESGTATEPDLAQLYFAL